jgi:octaprenyl-diphosphate synthase
LRAAADGTAESHAERRQHLLQRAAAAEHHADLAEVANRSRAVAEADMARAALDAFPASAAREALLNFCAFAVGRDR